MDINNQVSSLTIPTNISSSSLIFLVRLLCEKPFHTYFKSKTIVQLRGGRNRGINLPSPYFLSQFLPPPYFLFPHPGPSSSILPTPTFSFSPSCLLFPPISPSLPNFFLGHFSLLPILFLPPY